MHVSNKSATPPEHLLRGTSRFRGIRPSDGRLVGRTGRGGRRDELTSPAAGAQREGAEQRVVERHDVPDGRRRRSAHRLVAGRPTGLGGLGGDRPDSVEVGEGGVEVDGVDVEGLVGVGRLHVGGRRGDAGIGRRVAHVVADVRLSAAIQTTHRRLLLTTIPARAAR